MNRVTILSIVAAAILPPLLALAFWPALRRQVAYPGGRLSAAEADPAHWGLATGEQVWLEADDGVRLHGWWVPAEPTRDSPPARPTSACGAVIYFHGNANTIAPRAWLARRLAGLGLDVLLFDYRGYGRSEGRPREWGLRLDARAAWDHVVHERGVSPDRLILFGHSLGSAVAADLALERQPAALVLGAPFPSFPALFRHHAPWLPVRLLPWRDDRYEAGSRIGDLDVPVLMALGHADQVIPPGFTRQVYDAATEPRRLIETPAEHGTLIGHPDVWRALSSLLREVCPADR